MIASEVRASFTGPCSLSRSTVGHSAGIRCFSTKFHRLKPLVRVGFVASFFHSSLPARVLVSLDSRFKEENSIAVLEKKNEEE